MWRKRINYLSFIILLMVGLLFYHNYAFMIIIAFMVAAAAGSYLLLVFSWKKINIELEADKKSVGKNVPINLKFTINNKSLLVSEDAELKIKIQNNYYGNIDEYFVYMPVLSKRNTVSTLELSGIFCGVIRVSVESAKIYDLFGNFKKVKINVAETEVFVMPSEKDKYTQIVFANNASDEENDDSFAKGDDVSQISQIRDYIPGDRLSNIHWKLTAKSEEIQVKEFSMPYSEDVVLLVDMKIDKEHPEIFDEIIEVVNSVSTDFIRQNRKFSIVWYNNNSNFNCYEIINNDELVNVLKELFYTEISDEYVYTLDLFKSINQEFRGTIIFVSDKASAPDEGKKLDIGNEKVVLTCLY